ncbi:MAG: 2OG-Fe(II) oxygenase [Betaproteobacteria bacterium]
MHSGETTAPAQVEPAQVEQVGVEQISVEQISVEQGRVEQTPVAQVGIGHSYVGPFERAQAEIGQSAACQFDGLIADIAARGWTCAPHFLPESIWQPLAADLRTCVLGGRLRPAAIGAGATLHADVNARGDDIAWLDPQQANAAQQSIFARLEALRLDLNRGLQLGLFEFEGHYARYPAGAGYRRHLDQHRGNDARVLSCVLYLNPDWREQDGGCLRLYTRPDDSEHIDLQPAAGALVCFLSARFYHEVLPARRERLSLSGWFRRRA